MLGKKLRVSMGSLNSTRRQQRVLLGVMVAAFLLAGSTAQATVHTWTGASSNNLDSTAVNWSPTGSFASSDTAAWNGTQGGALSLTLTANSTTGMNPAAPGLFFYLNSAQISPVTINGTNGNVGTMRVAGVTIDAGAGAFTLGSPSLSTTTNVTLGATTNVNWINNSSSGGTIGANVFFNTSGAGARTIVFAGSGNWSTYGDLVAHNGGAISLTQSGAGITTLYGKTTYAGATAVAQGILAVTSTGAITASATIAVGNTSAIAAALYQSGTSTVTNTSTAGGGFQIGSAVGAFGYYNLAGGTINVGGEIDPGGSGGGAGTFGQFDMSGGVVNMPNIAGSYFLPNRGAAGEASVVNISGGTVQIAAGGTPADSNINGLSVNWTNTGVADTATITISGSGQFLTPSLRVKLNQGSSFTGITGNSSNVAELNLGTGAAGGTLQTLGFENGTGNNPNVYVNFNGGILKAGNAANASFLAGLGAAYVYASGGTINNNSQAITIGQGLLAPSGSGVTAVALSLSGSGYTVPPQVTITGDGSGATGYATISPTTGAVTGIVITNPGTGYSTATATLTGGGGSGAAAGTASLAAITGGGLTFTGTGATTLAGANTYTGLTNVSQGTLVFNGTHSGGDAYTIAAGATLAGSGAISGTNTVTFNSGANLAPGSAGNGLSLPNLALSGGASAAFGLSGTSTTAGQGINSLATVNGTPGNLSLAGITSVNVSLLNGVSLVSGGTYSLFTYSGTTNYTAGSLAFADSASILNSRQGYFFVNTGNAIDLAISGSAANLNWNVSSGSWNTLASPKNWLDAGTANTDYFVTGDNVNFTTAKSGTVTISEAVKPGSINVTGGYTFTASGSGKITGATSLTVQSPAALVLACTNDYSIGTFLTGGTISLGINNALPIADTLTMGTAASAGTFNLAGFSQQIAGLATDPTATAASQIITASVGSSTLTFNGGATSSSFAGTIQDTAPSGGTLGLTVAGGTLDLTSAAATNYFGATKISGGLLLLGTNLPNTSGVSVAAGSTLGVTGTSLSFTPGISNSGTLALTANSGTLALSGAISGTGAISVNGAAGLVTLSSPVTGSQAVTVPSSGTVAISSNVTGTLNKNGSGILILSGSNSFTAQATASSGTLVLANTAALPVAGVGTGANTATIDLATNTSVLPFNFNTNTTFNDTLVSDRATLGPGINQNLAYIQLGGGTFNVLTGPNVTSGGSLTANRISLTAGSTQTTIFNPIGVVLSTGTLDSAINAQSHTADLDGTSSGNQIGALLTSAGTLSVLKTNTSAWTITGPNSYTGSTTVSGGTLTYLSPIGSAGALTVQNQNSGAGTAVVLNLVQGSDTSVGSLSGPVFVPASGTNTATINTGNAGTNFIVTQTVAGEYDGVIAGNSNFTLAAASNTTLILGGTNTYTGTTSVLGGQLVVNGQLGSTTAPLVVGNPNTGAGTSVSLNLPASIDTTVGSLSGAVSSPASGTNTVTIYTGNVGTTFTVNQTAAGIFAGELNGSGNFTLGSLSTAALILSGANSNISPGNVAVSGGTLVVNGSLTAGSAQVNSAAALAGNGTIYAPLTLANGAILTAGYLGSGTLNLASGLTLGTAPGDASALNVTLAANPAVFNVTGAVNVVSGAGKVTINVATSGLPSVGNYPLISYTTGTITAAQSAAFTLGAISNRLNASLVDDTANNSLDLDVTGVFFPVWTGSQTTNWNTSDTNWVLSSNLTTPTQYELGDTVLFSDLAAANKTSITITGSNVSPTGTLFQNNVDNYTIQAGYGIAGAGGLSKSGSSSLTINSTNSYSGATTINGGVLNLNGAISGSGATSTTTVASGSANTVLNIAGTLTQYTIALGGGTGSTAAVHQTGGSVTTTLVAGHAVAIGDANGAYGYYKLGGGALTTQETQIGTWGPTGNNDGGSGILAVSGGTLNNLGWVVMTRSAAANPQSGVLDLSGGLINFAGGGLAANWGTTQTAVINVRGGSLVTTNSTGINLNFSGDPSNTGILNLNGGLVGANGVSGSSSIVNFNGGTLQAAGANANFLAVGNAYIFAGGATIDSNGSAITIAQALLAPSGSGVTAGGLAFSGSGYIAPPIVSITDSTGSGATALANLDANGNLIGITITNPGVGYTAPSFSVSGGGGMGGSISGTAGLLVNSTSGGLTKIGAGLLILSGSNLYTGATTVSAGTLSIGSGGAGEFLASAAIANSAALVFNHTDTMTYSGNISGPGTLAKLAGGTTVLMGSNNYSGLTTLSAGILELGSPGALAGSGNVTFNGGSLEYSSSNAADLSSRIANSTSAISILTNSATVQYNGVIGSSNTAGLTVLNSPGMLVLAASNNYSGTTTIGSGQGQGTILAAASGALGTGTVTFDGQGNGSTALLQLANSITLANPISLIGRNSGTPAIENISGNNTLSGGITLQVGGTYYIQSDAGLLTISGGTAISSNAGNTRNVNLQGNGNGLISGAVLNGSATLSLTKLGGGTWTISSTANSYTGGSNVNAGVLEFARTAAMPAQGTVTVATSATLAVNAGGPGEFTSATSGTGSIGGLLAGIGGQGAPVSWGSGAILGIDTTDATGNLLYSGSIGNTAGGPLGLSKLGAGTLELSGTNSYTGGTEVLAGTLVLDSASAIESGTSLSVGTGASSLFAPVFAAPMSAAVGAGAETVPEPGALALLAAASAGLLAMYRRRRAHT
jgi:fibronectin-binding autotransporter adhesin